MMLLGLLLLGFGYMLMYAGRNGTGVWDELLGAFGRTAGKEGT